MALAPENEVAQKICRYCKKEIDAKASRCPFCTTILRWGAADVVPFLGWLVIVLLLASIDSHLANMY
jgi:hypothetical protein